MAEHSPEPWEVGDDAGEPWIMADGHRSVVHSLGAVDEADARRIVACVNACARIPTEALEEGFIEKALRGLKSYVDASKADAEFDEHLRSLKAKLEARITG